MFAVDDSWSAGSTKAERRLHKALFGREEPQPGAMATAERPIKEGGRGSGGKYDVIPAEKGPQSKRKAARRGKKHSGAMKAKRQTGSELKHKGSSFRCKMLSKIEGSRFRWINEQLYTSTSSKAWELFEQEPVLFPLYHSGFRTQVAKWPVNPLDRVIQYVQTLPAKFVVADFGCGEGRLAKCVPQKVHSFDLVALDDHVTACDMASVPLGDATVDVCVFCLSLMGTNTSDFLKEARRVLKNKGRLKVCEIESRIASIDDFVRKVEAFGFASSSKETFSKMFVDLEFRAASLSGPAAHVDIDLKPCIYKRR